MNVVPDHVKTFKFAVLRIRTPLYILATGLKLGGAMGYAQSTDSTIASTQPMGETALIMLRKRQYPDPR